MKKSKIWGKRTIAVSFGLSAFASCQSRSHETAASGIQADSLEQAPEKDLFAPDALEPIIKGMQLSAASQKALRNYAAPLGQMFKQSFDFRNVGKQPGEFQRPVFLKTHGCAAGTLTVAADLPDEYRQGLFSEPGGTVKQVWLRSSSDTAPATSDFKNSTVGIAVKVMGVDGPKVMPGEKDATTQDFLLQNHHVFFSDDAREFYNFLLALQGKPADLSDARKEQLMQILREDMPKAVSNVLSGKYWSTTPYRYGDAAFAKYVVEPCGDVGDEAAPADTPANRNYLRERWRRELRSHGACFDFKVQLRPASDPAASDFPLDAATVEWPETSLPPLTVARIEIPPTREFQALESTCEHFSFMPWHALAAHKPVGTINEVRGLVYKRLADHRRGKNLKPIVEPEPAEVQ